MPVILATWEAEIRRIMFQGHTGQIVCKDPIFKITRTKWNRSVVQTIYHLLCKCEALNETPVSPKKKKRKRSYTFSSYMKWN
jgi:hypothetical protein